MGDQCVFNPTLVNNLRIGANIILCLILLFITYQFFITIKWSA